MPKGNLSQIGKSPNVFRVNKSFNCEDIIPEAPGLQEQFNNHFATTQYNSKYGVGFDLGREAEINKS